MKHEWNSENLSTKHKDVHTILACSQRQMHRYIQCVHYSITRVFLSIQPADKAVEYIIDSYKLILLRVRLNINTHTRTHARTHAHTHTHTHIAWLPGFRPHFTPVNHLHGRVEGHDDSWFPTTFYKPPVYYSRLRIIFIEGVDGFHWVVLTYLHLVETTCLPVSPDTTVSGRLDSKHQLTIICLTVD